MKKKQSSIGQWLVSGVVVILAIAVGVFIWRKATQAGGEPTPVPASTTAASAGTGPAAASTAIQHPIAQATPALASTAPLPALDASDTDVASALLALGGSPLDGLLRRDQIIRRVVATVDALPRQSVGTNILPLKTPQGAFVVEQADGAITLSPRNAERYAPYMQVLEGVDPKALVAWYVAHYPLFQQAYRDLGYPKGYFNDRLVIAIDDMLAAPVPDGPVALVQPKVFYRYADAGLEARSAGQKLLMRLGADDEAQVKAKLRQIRALLTGATLPAGAASAR
ncbi:DUF3014 domain-containing protein [Frateuria sp. MAH-13]|uniref:DUF3014 domain-containing protein n=1 Tax=Frateuria flava TaxID=2821489 RepID=A0ABS4DMV9_9GAMM|nr:DUF3014 domain-containing protein [Frateuria flava]MBP1474399.1 DUF3014 domain-containing protein [Frateuria flava]